MNFASIDFWIRLAASVCGALLILGIVRRWRPSSEGAVGKCCLLFTGLFLLCSESWLTLGCFLWVALLGWAAALTCCGYFPKWSQKAVFWTCIVLQLLPLLHYKYWNFFVVDVLGLDLAVPHALIPIGLSFYTFQKIAFCIDTRKSSLPLPKFLDYMNFASFFPQIVAGPIERRQNLLPQIAAFQFRLRRGELAGAMSWIVLGLFFKLALADNLAIALNGCQRIPGNAYQAWIQALVDGFRIYFDFGGYSFIAVGLGQMFGIRLSMNFLSPYTTTDLRMFWQHWHITLSRWLRDYIYIPMGGGRTAFWWFNILFVFFVSGLWHGAGWNFILWGVFHGAGVLACNIGKPLPLPPPVKWLATMAFAFFGWMIFFETDPGVLHDKIVSMLAPGGYGMASLRQIPGYFRSQSDLINLLVLLGISTLVVILELAGRMRGDVYGHLRTLPASVIMVAVTVLWAPLAEAPFIYFNF